MHPPAPRGRHIPGGSNDLCYGSGIYKDEFHVEGSITFFVKHDNNNDHYALTA